MKFDHNHYIPCLRWKQGEYQAIWRLPIKTRRVFTPLIEVPGIGYDFENETQAKSIDEHLAPFAKRIYEKWGRLPCFIDLNLIEPSERMTTGIHPLRYVFDRLRERQCPAIAVTGLDRDNAYQQEIKSIVEKDKAGICLRIKIEQAAKNSFKDELDSLLLKIKAESKNCDLVIDLGSPNFIPLEGFSKAIQAIVRNAPYLNVWRTFTILGTSFPTSMSGIRKGGEIVPRYEWKLYKILVNNFRKAKLRLPTFGDYVINYPVISELDWRVVKPPATIRYTIDDNWYILKGKNVRDYGYDQYHDLSQNILDSRYYYGPAFSWGDEFIQRCANGGNLGNLSTWRQVGTNHHIEKVVRDIASFYAS
jgi:hypothetical protein